LCITSGCDFNTTMYRVACKTAYNKLITRYGYIDRFPLTYNVSCLNHVACRNIFYPQASQGLIVEEEIPVAGDTVTVANRYPPTTWRTGWLPGTQLVPPPDWPTSHMALQWT
jgi:hypothetical protein